MLTTVTVTIDLSIIDQASPSSINTKSSITITNDLASQSPSPSSSPRCGVFRRAVPGGVEVAPFKDVIHNVAYAFTIGEVDDSADLQQVVVKDDDVMMADDK